MEINLNPGVVVEDVADYQEHNDPVIRDIADWSIKYEQDNIGPYVSLTGRVVKDSHRPIPEGVTRYTNTSPILTTLGTKVVLEDGGIYTLIGEPHKSYLSILELKNLTYNSKNPIPMELLHA